VRVNGTESNRTDRRAHPIVAVLVDQGRTQSWLARRIGRSHEHTNRVLNGVHPATAEFRQACARALGVAEGVLFHGQADDSNAAPVREGELVGRSSTAVRALYGTDGVGSIGRMAYPGAATRMGGAAGE
jgi:hypothetical protein